MGTGSLVVRKLGCDRAGEIAIRRFLWAASVTCGEMVATLASRTAAACTGRRIVAAQDTTEINFAGREERCRGLGPAGDGLSAGFFIHPVVAIDGETEAVLGVLAARIWARTDEFVATPAGRRIGRQGKHPLAGRCGAGGDASGPGGFGGGRGGSRRRHPCGLRAAAGVG